ncbi:MAG: hypothetical protein EPO23_00330 [Xanthobacteraceae bacterium]|nr:MAG: hypothetical protein EPO23_00330 [Xanthobacteraceae bacterium]
MRSSLICRWSPLRLDAASAAPCQHTPSALCQAILRCVAGEFAVPPGELASRTRRGPHIVLARQTAMYLAHVAFALPFGEIARCFGRDRTTAAHACRRIEDRRDDARFDRRLAALEIRILAATGARACVAQDGEVPR